MFVGEGVAVVLVWVVSLSYSGLDVFVLRMAGAGVGLSGWALWQTEAAVAWKRSDLGVGVGIVAVLVSFMLTLFPSGFVEQQVNIFAHGAGLVWGAIIATAMWIGSSYSAQSFKS
ncbi:hypothetical protein [Halapricum desulfuricans]|nr:hypothetical protein [Halapricum desulfuricans]